jgi:hypothetical protein
MGSSLILWQRGARGYASGESGLLGRFIVFYINPNTNRNLNDGRWSLWTSLPGLDHSVGPFEDIESAKEHADEVLAEWLEDADLASSLTPEEIERQNKRKEAIAHKHNRD